MVGNKDQHCLRIGGAEVVFQRRELFLLRPPGIEVLQVFDEDGLKWRHQGRGTGQVEHLKNAGFGQIEVAERKLAQRGVYEQVHDSAAAALVKEDFISGENVPGPQRTG